MRRMRGVGVVVAVTVLLSGVSACGGDTGGGGGKAGSASSSPASKAPVVSPREALDAYGVATASGCTDAADCQAFMTRKLAAADVVKAAMVAKDPAVYAEPIGMVTLAGERADHYGRDNLGAKGNSFAVAQPLQEMVAWFREHPGS